MPAFGQVNRVDDEHRPLTCFRSLAGLGVGGEAWTWRCG